MREGSTLEICNRLAVSILENGLATQKRMLKTESQGCRLLGVPKKKCVGLQGPPRALALHPAPVQAT